LNQSEIFPTRESLLSPYRVLDLTDGRGVLCGKILADLGADVIKIERPGGDPARNIGPFYHDIPHPERSLFWFALNTNKRGITLNIETSDGREIFKKLVEGAHFVIESFDPGYLAGLGLSYSVLSKLNSQIIMTSITPFGQTGPFACYKGSDMVVFAMGLLMSQCGDTDRSPVEVSFPQSFMNAGADAAVGTLIAHYYREATGEGQHVDISAMESVVECAGEVQPVWFLSRRDPKRPGREFIYPGGRHAPIVWECKDGYVNFVIQAGQPGARNNGILAKWMDAEDRLPEYLKKRDWESWDWSVVTQDELASLTEVIASFLKSHTKAEIWSEAVERGIMLYPVNTPEEILVDPQLKARHFWVEIEHGELNDTLTYTGPFAQFSETPMKKWHRAPLIGEHNEEIYERELGFYKEELIALKQSGVI